MYFASMVKKGWQTDSTAALCTEHSVSHSGFSAQLATSLAKLVWLMRVSINTGLSQFVEVRFEGAREQR